MVELSRLGGRATPPEIVKKRTAPRRGARGLHYLRNRHPRLSQRSLKETSAKVGDRGPEGRGKLAGGASHRYFQKKGRAPEGRWKGRLTSGNFSRPIRGSPLLDARTGGWRHRLISVVPAGPAFTRTFAEVSFRMRDAFWADTGGVARRGLNHGLMNYHRFAMEREPPDICRGLLWERIGAARLGPPC